MHKWLWFIAGGIVFGVSLLSHLPAQLVVPENMGRFQFIGIGGSLWHGEVEQVLLSGKALPIRNLNWAVNPIALLTGKLVLDVHEQPAPDNHGNVSLSLRSRQLELHALHWQLPSSSLDTWIPLPGFGARGRLVLDLQTMQLEGDTFFPSRLKGRLDWLDAELKYGPGYWHVGSPAVQFFDQGGAIKGIARNSQPMLPGECSLECTTESCELELNLRPTPDAPRFVLNGLMLLGLRQNGDSFSGQVVLSLE